MKKQKLEINNLKDKIKELENRIDEMEENINKIKEQSSEDISTCHKLIYLATTDFIGSLTNKNLISELKNWCYCDTEIAYLEYSYDTILNLIKAGQVYPNQVNMLYSKIKNLEEIERTIKKYGETKNETNNLGK